MLKKISLAIIGTLFALALPSQALAETVMEKVSRTGILTVGTRTDLIPYAYLNDKQELVGYSIDILNLIRDQLSKELEREITIQVVEVAFDDRIPQLINRDVDIVCENVSFTWERDRFVDFSISYSISGVNLLVKKGSTLGLPESLKGKKIGAVPNTTGEKAIKLVAPEAILVPLQTVEESFAALNKGDIDAIAGDLIVLDGLRQTQGDPNAYEIVPNGKTFARYGVACMIPQNNSTFLNHVNYAIALLMQGYLVNDPKSVEIVERWFGPQGIVSLDTNVIRDFFQGIITTTEQIPLDKLPTSTEK